MSASAWTQDRRIWGQEAHEPSPNEPFGRLDDVQPHDPRDDIDRDALRRCVLEAEASARRLRSLLEAIGG